MHPSVPEIARICDVQVDVGGDQLLILEASERADVYLRILRGGRRRPAVQACGQREVPFRGDRAEVAAPSGLREAGHPDRACGTGVCGTGACVAVRAAQLRGLVEPGPVGVDMGAGLVMVELAGGGAAVMTGPVAFCYTGRLPEHLEGTT